MFYPQRPRRRGRFAPLLNLFDSIGYSWWKFRRNLSRLLNTRWLTEQLSYYGHRFMDGCRYPFYMIGWLLRQLGSMLVAWWQIRNFRYLIQGIPALATIVVVIVIGAYTMLRSDDGLQEMYSRNAIEANVRGESSKAQLCYERLMILQPVNDPKRQETIFRLALLCRQQTPIPQIQRANSYITAIANPDTNDGYADAHVYLAQDLLSNQTRTPERWKLAEQHLRRALQKNPEHSDANYWLGIILWNQEQSREAIPFLLKVDARNAAYFVPARLTVAQYFMANGQQIQAQNSLSQVIETLQNKARTDLDDISYRVYLARAYKMLDEFEKAVEVLEEGIRVKNSDFYHFELSNCYVSWFDYLGKSRRTATPESEMNRLTMLMNALKADPNNAIAIKHLVHFMSRSGIDADERAEAHRMQLARDGRNAFLRLWKGEKLLQEGKTDEARKEWELAYQYNPDSPIIANNFAWILTFGDNKMPPLTPDLQRALRIINQVIEGTPKTNPNLPYFHGTRGTIYKQMGRNREALDELLLACQRTQAPRAEDDLILQSQLVDVYLKLGMRDDALGHQLLIDKYRKKMEEERTKREQAPAK
jgi:tetratricopeptide (TPR) repeat protein